MIIAKGREIKEFSEIVTIQDLVTEFTFEPENTMRKKLNIQTFNAENGELLSNVLLRLKKTNSKISTEGLTKENGCFGYIIDENCQYSLDITRRGFISYTMEFNQTKGNEAINTINVPLFPILKTKSIMMHDQQRNEDVEVKTNIMRAILVSDDQVHAGQITLELYSWIVNPENNEEEEFCIPKDKDNFSNDNLTIVYNDFELGKVISIEETGNDSNTKWFRLTGNVVSGEIVEPNYWILDHNFKNRMQDWNFKVMIFDDNKLVSINYAPWFNTYMTVWDVGLMNVASKRFLSINSFNNATLERKTYMKFYLNLFKFLNEVDENFDFKVRFSDNNQFCNYQNIIQFLIILFNKYFIWSRLI